MAKNYGNQQLTTATWVPYEPAKDCSLRVCSSYCPRWCDVVLPQPPPTLFRSGAADGGTSSGRTFSPLVIAVIGFLASAFLLLSYYTIVTKYCGTFSSRRRRRDGVVVGVMGLDEEGWPVSSPSNGLDEVAIGKIAVHKYKRSPSASSAADCAVCLSEFQEEESIRVLPKCSHAFHVQCIDTWLRSHCSCPLCRTDIVPAVNSQQQQQRPDAAENPATEEARELSTVAVMAEGGRAIEAAEGEGDFQAVRRSLSMDFSGCVISSSRWWAAAPEQSNSSSRRLCAMVRSFSSGRLPLTMQGKGRNAVLPI